MMISRVIVVAIAVLLTSLAMSEGMSLGVKQHCRCLRTESRRIGRHIDTVELIPPNSHCVKLEVIATLKRTGRQVCLDPQASWVKNLIQRISPTDVLTSPKAAAPLNSDEAEEAKAVEPAAAEAAAAAAV